MLLKKYITQSHDNCPASVSGAEEGEKKVKKRNKGLLDIFEDVCCAICDNYCKYADQCEKGEISEDELYIECDKCVLSILC